VTATLLEYRGVDLLPGMNRSKHEAATMASPNGEAAARIEIVGDRRRAHGAALRTMVVAEASEPGVRVHDVAARHGICPSLVYRWRRVAGVGRTSRSSVHLFPVRLAAALEDGFADTAASSPGSGPKPRRAGVIAIELSNGVGVSVDEGVSVAALRRVMSVVRG
jgi:transposase